MFKILLLFFIDAYFVISGLMMVETLKQIIVIVLALVFLLAFISVLKKVVMYVGKKSKNKGSLFKYLFKPFVDMRSTILKEPKILGITAWPDSKIVIPLAGAVGGLCVIVIAGARYFEWREVSYLLCNLATLFILISVFVEPVFKLLRTRSFVVLLKSIQVNIEIKFIFMFTFLFTFLTPMAWFAVFFLILLQAVIKVKTEKALIIN